MYYGTIAKANTYFETRLRTYNWDVATISDRTSALTMATRDIDRLSFAGDKSDENQVLQFPRSGDTEVPTAIEEATYEVALEYLNGLDLNMESNKLGMITSSFSGTRTTYSEDYVALHIRNGILSIYAWYLLTPFLRDMQDVTLSRVS